MPVESANMPPLISVLMPVYNSALTVREAVDSILGQTCKDFQLLIINDGSTDGTMDAVASFEDSRIVVLENGRNLGLGETLNRGIAAARGKYIARMDADDISAPDRLARQAAFLEKHQQVGLVGTWAELIDADGRVTGRARNLTRDEELRINLLFSVPFFHPSVMVRAELLKQNPYDTSYPQAQDYELWTRLAEVTRLANIPHYLLKYRWHDSNISVRENRWQEEKKREVLRRELAKLGIEPSEDELRVHQAAFGKSIDGGVSAAELAAWYSKLIAANKKFGRYNKPMFRAYLWSRFAVFCKESGSFAKAVYPGFASLNPLVLFYLFHFLRHFAGKRR